MSIRVFAAIGKNREAEDNLKGSLCSNLKTRNILNIAFVQPSSFPEAPLNVSRVEMKSFCSSQTGKRPGPFIYALPRPSRKKRQPVACTLT
jgi:hypothetical protein